MILVEHNIGHTAHHSLEHLVAGGHVVKAGKGNGVGNAGVMCVEGQDIGHAHVDQLLQHDCAVQRLARGTLVLAPLVQHRHDDRDAACFAADGGDDALEICIVVIGAHALILSEHLVGDAVVEHIAEDVHILPPHRLLDGCFSFAGTEPATDGVRQVRVLSAVASPLLQVPVHLLRKLFAAPHPDDAQVAVQCLFHNSQSLSFFCKFDNFRSEEMLTEPGNAEIRHGIPVRNSGKRRLYRKCVT